MASCTRGRQKFGQAFGVIGALVRFRVSSPNQENGFVAFRFVADPARNSFTGLRVLATGLARMLMAIFVQSTFQIRPHRISTAGSCCTLEAAN
jgi:hypothetical protein